MWTLILNAYWNNKDSEQYLKELMSCSFPPYYEP